MERWNDCKRDYPVASHVMMCAKASLHDLMSDVGMKSSGYDLDDIVFSKRSTAVSVNVSKTERNLLDAGSDDRGSNICLANDNEIAAFMFRTLLTKNAASVEQKAVSSSVGAVIESC